jgi:hypothetical protein
MEGNGQRRSTGLVHGDNMRSAEIGIHPHHEKSTIAVLDANPFYKPRHVHLSTLAGANAGCY